VSTTGVWAGIDTVDPERFARLPRWAQDRMLLMARRLDEAQAKIAELRNDVPSDTYAVDNTHGSRYLRARQTVRFTPDLEHPYEYIDAGLTPDRELAVTAHPGPLSVHPWVSNAVRIRLGTDR